jgi:thioredoxin-like negative regulator of GroEL
MLRSVFSRPRLGRGPGDRRTACRALAIGVWVWCLATDGVFAADPKDPLESARVLYNQRQFQAAIEAAEEVVKQLPARADSANLVAARAYLEQYRETAVPDDLASARHRLRSLNPEGFNATERIEFVVGLGEILFFDGAPGAAAAIFGSVLAGPDTLTPAARDGLLDWWASSVDRDARRLPDIERRAIYQRVLDRMHLEVAANPGSTAAAYWLAAAAWGQGDLNAAWDAALAAWVRAILASDRDAALRGDLDRLVLRGIIPDRAKATAQPVDVLAAEWTRFKEQWTK